MNISFPSKDPIDTVLVDSTNGAALYQTQSHNVVRRVTHLMKFAPNIGGFQTLAEIHWENMTLNPATVIYRGQKIYLTEFLKVQGLWIWNRGHVFYAADRRQYKWKTSSSLKCRLYDDADNLVAESHDKHLGILHKAQDYNIDILPPGIPFVDDIILTYIIVNHLERLKRDRGNTAAIIANS